MHPLAPAPLALRTAQVPGWAPRTWLLGPAATPVTRVRAVDGSRWHVQHVAERRGAGLVAAGDPTSGSPS